MRAEQHESWPARAQRIFDDMHLVWIGLASAAATFVLAGSILSILHAAPERNDSLAAVFAMLGAPAGSNLNPASLDGRGLNLGPTRVLAPTVPQDGIVYATLENSSIPDDVDGAAVGEGHDGRPRRTARDAGPSVSPRQVRDLMDALSRGRLEPAQYGGAPVAVSLVWLLANTTVKREKPNNLELRI